MPTITNDPNKSVCEHWATLAKQMTGSGKFQTCVNDKSKSCTRVDCTGTVLYPVGAIFKCCFFCWTMLIISNCFISEDTYAQLCLSKFFKIFFFLFILTEKKTGNLEIVKEEYYLLRCPLQCILK